MFPRLDRSTLIPITRLLLCAFLVSCSRIDERKLIGTWRHEDDDGVSEMTFGQDHSYTSAGTFKGEELVTPSVIEQVGAWRLERNRLKIDSVVTWSKEPAHISISIVDLVGDRLRIKDTEGKKTLLFSRFHVPHCLEQTPGSATRLTEADLLGTWEFHYHTHDYRYAFETGARAKFFALILGEWRELDDGATAWSLGRHNAHHPPQSPSRFRGNGEMDNRESGRSMLFDQRRQGYVCSAPRRRFCRNSRFSSADRNAVSSALICAR